jgi:hypothetical protein
MADWVIAGMFAIGVATWVYVKFSRRSNMQTTSYTAAAFVGIVAFIVFITFLKYIIHV